MGHPVLAGQARDPDRRRAAAAARDIEAAEGHHDRYAEGGLTMGFEIGIAWLSVLLFGSLGLLLMLGLPMAFCTGSLAVIFLYVFGSGGILNMLPSRVFPFMTDYQLSVVPPFIFMATVREHAGIIQALFGVIYKWLGAPTAGLASAPVLACTVLAALASVRAAAE